MTNTTLFAIKAAYYVGDDNALEGYKEVPHFLCVEQDSGKHLYVLSEKINSATKLFDTKKAAENYIAAHKLDDPNAVSYSRVYVVPVECREITAQEVK